MDLFLHILSGPSQGEKIKIQGDSTIGRHGADICIQDPKLSKTHALFKKKSNSWELVDQGSRNGVWVDGQSQVQVSLQDGLEVTLGDTRIQIRLLQPLDTAPDRETPQSWDWLKDECLLIPPSQLGEMEEIRPCLHLKVVRGPQLGQEWEIFYGPRVAGFNALDICLYDKQAPQKAFEIRVDQGRPLFYTHHPKLAGVRRCLGENSLLQTGDVIYVGETEILVEFQEEFHEIRS